VLVVGGTRGTGRLVVQLLRDGGRSVRVLARDPGVAKAQLDASVEILPGDITRPETLPRAVEGVAHVIFTAGVRSGRPSSESRIRETEYGGTRNTLDAARSAGFTGRFLYMTASGVTARSFASFALNLYKGNTLVWRRRAEEEIRASGLDYTIIRTGVLLNAPARRHALAVTQRRMGLSFRHRIARGDVAEVFVAALAHPRASRATFDVVWGRGPRQGTVSSLLDELRPDAEMTEAHA